MSDFLRDQTSGELAGWLAYLRVDDEAQAQRTAIAMMKAFRGGLAQPAKQADDDDQIIDTTDPKFAQQFQGFINTPGRPQQTIPRPMQSTQIIKG